MLAVLTVKMTGEVHQSVLTVKMAGEVHQSMLTVKMAGEVHQGVATAGVVAEGVLQGRPQPGGCVGSQANPGSGDGDTPFSGG